MGDQATLPVSVRNNSNANLTITELATTDPAFSSPTPVPFDIPPGQTASITVRFAPLTAGLFAGNLYLRSVGSTQLIAQVVSLAGAADTFVPVSIQDFAAEASASGVALAWKLGAGWRGSVRGIQVQRADSQAGPYADLAAAPLAPAAAMSFQDASVEPGRDYWYRIGMLSPAGRLQTAAPIRIGTASRAPLRTVLYTPVVPASGPVEIRYALGNRPAQLRLAIFDVRGRLVRVLQPASREPGQYVRTWDRQDAVGRPAPHGVYLVQLRAGAWAESKKLVLSR